MSLSNFIFNLTLEQILFAAALTIEMIPTSVWAASGHLAALEEVLQLLDWHEPPTEERISDIVLDHVEFIRSQLGYALFEARELVAPEFLARDPATRLWRLFTSIGATVNVLHPEIDQSRWAQLWCTEIRSRLSFRRNFPQGIYRKQASKRVIAAALREGGIPEILQNLHSNPIINRPLVKRRANMLRFDDVVDAAYRAIHSPQAGSIVPGREEPLNYVYIQGLDNWNKRPLPQDNFTDVAFAVHLPSQNLLSVGVKAAPYNGVPVTPAAAWYDLEPWRSVAVREGGSHLYTRLYRWVMDDTDPNRVWIYFQ